MSKFTCFMLAAAMAITSSKAQGEELCISLEGKLCNPPKPAACRKSKAVLVEEQTRCEKGLDGDAAAADDNGEWDKDDCSCAFEASEHEFCDLPVPPAPKADGVREVHGAYQCSWAVTKASQAGNAKRTGGLENAVFGAKNAEGKREGGLVIDLDVLKKTVGMHAAAIKAHGERLDGLEAADRKFKIDLDAVTDRTGTLENKIDGAPECANVRAGTVTDADKEACAKNPGLVLEQKDTRRRVSEHTEQLEELFGRGKLEFGIGGVALGYIGPSLTAKIGDKTETIRGGSGVGAGLVGTLGLDLVGLYAGGRFQGTGILEGGQHSGVSGVVGAEVGPRWDGHSLLFGAAWAPNSLGTRGGTSKAIEASVGYRGVFTEGWAFDARFAAGYQSTGALVIVHPEGQPDQVGNTANSGAAASLTAGIIKVF